MRTTTLYDYLPGNLLQSLLMRLHGAICLTTAHARPPHSLQSTSQAKVTTHSLLSTSQMLLIVLYFYT
jgi:hypothetical protein